MTDRHRIFVEHAGGRIALARWGDADARKPPALLVHGITVTVHSIDTIVRTAN